MKLFPAIDLRNGKVVRLHKGSFDDETEYGSDPVSVARGFEEAGAPWIHVVDLDGARTGQSSNRQVVSAITEAVSVPVQSSGGVRSADSARSLLDTGVSRIVLGTVATEAPELVDELAAAHPGRIAVGLDARGGTVAVHGWESSGGVTVLDAVRRFTDSGVAAFVITDIERDGTLGGPDTSGLASVLEVTEVDVVASGGVGTLEDLATLARLRSSNGRKLAGSIVGKAIYEKRFAVADAVTVCETDGGAA